VCVCLGEGGGRGDKGGGNTGQGGRWRVVRGVIFSFGGAGVASEAWRFHHRPHHHHHHHHCHYYCHVGMAAPHTGKTLRTLQHTPPPLTHTHSPFQPNLQAAA